MLLVVTTLLEALFRVVELTRNLLQWTTQHQDACCLAFAARSVSTSDKILQGAECGQGSRTLLQRPAAPMTISVQECRVKGLREDGLGGPAEADTAGTC